MKRYFQLKKGPFSSMNPDMGSCYTLEVTLPEGSAAFIYDTGKREVADANSPVRYTEQDITRLLGNGVWVEVPAPGSPGEHCPRCGAAPLAVRDENGEPTGEIHPGQWQCGSFRGAFRVGERYECLRRQRDRLLDELYDLSKSYRAFYQRTEDLICSPKPSANSSASSPTYETCLHPRSPSRPAPAHRPPAGKGKGPGDLWRVRAYMGRRC